MKSNKPSLMKNRVTFLSNESTGPEVGTGLTEIYECACDDYEPTMKDVTAIGAPAGKNMVTLTVRNVYQEFRPQSSTSENRNELYFENSTHYERAVVLLVSHYFENRLPMIETELKNLPYGIQSAVQKLRGGYYEI